jgi:hypothetical protein
MTAATLYRVPRRMFRKLAKPALLWINAWRFRHSEFELARLRTVGNAVAEAREYRHQVKLRMQRIRIGAW